MNSVSADPSLNAVRDALDRAGYRFVVHGISTVRRRRVPEQSARSERSSRRAQNQPYVPRDIRQFDLAEFADHDRLYSVFCILRSEGGPAVGTDGITYSDFSNPEIYEALRHLSSKLVSHQYIPHETRLVCIPKGDGRFRRLQLNRILDRVVAKALQLATDAFWRVRLPRLGKDVPDLYATMQQAMQHSGARWLTPSDIRDCFPRTPIETVLACHRRHISQPDLLWLIETIVRGHEGPEHTTGLYQGSPYSPVAMELLLHTHLDTWFGTEYRGLPLLLRYVDNLNIVTRSAREGREALRFCERVLEDLGFNLKPERPPMDAPMDLRTTHPGRKVLGLNPCWRNEQLHFTIPETAYSNLREGLAESIVKPDPLATAFAVATGWLNAMGPALTNSATSAVIDRVIRISRECGFTEIRSCDLQGTCRLANAKWQVLANEGGRGDV